MLTTNQTMSLLSTIYQYKSYTVQFPIIIIDYLFYVFFSFIIIYVDQALHISAINVYVYSFVLFSCFHSLISFHLPTILPIKSLLYCTLYIVITYYYFYNVFNVDDDYY